MGLLPNMPLQQSAARYRDWLRTACRPWLATTGSLVSTAEALPWGMRPLLNGATLGGPMR